MSLYQEQTKEVMGSIVVEYMGIFVTSAAEAKEAVTAVKEKARGLSSFLLKID